LASSTFLQASINKTHNAVEQQLNNMVKNVSSDCTTSAKGKAFQSNYEGGVKNHTKCRNVQGVAKQAKEDCEGKLTALKDLKKTACDVAELKATPDKELCEPAAGEVDRGHWLKMNADTFQKKYETYKKKKEECDNATAAVKGKTCTDDKKGVADSPKDCDKILDALEAAACSWANEKVFMCKTFDKCYSTKKAKYDADVELIKEQEKGRKLQWRMTSRFKCLFNSGKSGKVDKKALDKCADHGQYKTKHLDLKYPEFPKKGTCEDPTVYPGTEPYKTAVYASLPKKLKVRDPVGCPGLPEKGGKAAAKESKAPAKDSDAPTKAPAAASKGKK